MEREQMSVDPATFTSQLTWPQVTPVDDVGGAMLFAK